MNTSFDSRPPVGPTPAPAPSRWASLHRLLRVLLGIVVALVTLIALFYLEEDLRGKHAWGVYAQQMTERGEVYQLKAVVPPPVPDDQNFAMTPFLAPLVDFLPGTQTWRDTNATQRAEQFGNDLSSVREPTGNWREGKRTDWPAWQAAIAEASLKEKHRTAHAQPATTEAPVETNQLAAAAAVLAKLKEYAPVLDEFRTASRRPYSRFNLCYDAENCAGILLPHLAVIKKSGRVLALRASAELTLGQPDVALADLDLALYLASTVRNEPFLISHLVRCAMIQLALQPVWEGLADHQWTDAQVATLQQQLAGLDFLADDATAMRGEQAAGNSVIAYARQNPRQLDYFVGEDQAAYNEAAVIALFMPRGWFYLEQVNYNRCFDAFVRQGVDLGARRVNPEQLQQNEEAIEQTLRGGISLLFGHRVMSAMLIPAIPPAHQKFAFTQTMVDEAVLACGLERFRLANGRYPDSLAELTPRFVGKLPHDLFTGEPLKYRRTDDGRFVLYSVGWDGKDDGGMIAKRAVGKSSQMDSSRGGWSSPGDWVWPAPAP